MQELYDAVRDVPDFPKKGIVFKDITPILQAPKLFKTAIDKMAEFCEGKNIDIVAGIESRGFIFGAAIAYKLGIGFVPVRKKGKLPYEKEFVTYSLEYGEDTLEIHKDAFKNASNVLVVDDLLATGGTLEAVCKLVEKVGGNVVQIACLIELKFLGGRDKLSGYNCNCVLSYE